MIHEIGYDASHQRLEALLPAVFLRIESAVPLHYPTHVSWPVGTQNKRWGACGLGLLDAQDAFYRAHRADNFLPVCGGKRFEQCDCLGCRLFIYCDELFPAATRK
jgi:hypothetical protein